MWTDCDQSKEREDRFPPRAWAKVWSSCLLGQTITKACVVIRFFSSFSSFTATSAKDDVNVFITKQLKWAKLCSTLLNTKLLSLSAKGRDCLQNFSPLTKKHLQTWFSKKNHTHTDLTKIRRCVVLKLFPSLYFYTWKMLLIISAVNSALNRNLRLYSRILF